jgi:hypothetical protein
MTIFKKIISRLEELMKENFLILFVLLIFIGLIRNFLEVMGNQNGFVTGYYLSVPSFSNTISYVFLMIIAEGYFINLLFKGNKDQLRSLIQKGSWLLLGLFIAIPIFSNLFNYNFLKLPIYYGAKFIDKIMLFMHYGPVGIHVAFFLVLFIFPFWLKKFYKSSLRKSVVITWVLYIIHYLYTYQLTMALFFGKLMKYNIFSPYYTARLTLGPAMDRMVNMYTASFVIVTLIVYPFFMEKYSRTEREKRQLVIVYFILWIHFISLFFLNFPWKA